MVSLWSVSALVLAACAVADESFIESFNYPTLAESGWEKSSWAEASGDWELSHGDTAWHGHSQYDAGLIVKSPAQRHAISKHLATAVDPHGAPELIVQYDVRFHNHMECGGAYLKALSVQEDRATDPVDSDTAYSIMFGPDKCGATDKVHFILKHRSPVSEKWSEHHATKVPSIVNDRFTHQYRLEIRADNTYAIKIDNVVKSEGNLLTDLEPAIIPPETIPDPEDTKPVTWNDIAKIPDATQTKPADWDEDQPRMVKDENAVKPEDWDEQAPLKVVDPEATQPEDWNVEEDGEWKAPLVENPACDSHGCGPWAAPLVPNPLYKGKWKAEMIDNPDYDGIWSARQIPNPEYFTTEDATEGMAMITDLAFEIWTMQNGIEFDNIYIGHSAEEADQLTKEYFQVKKDKEIAAHAEFAPKTETTGEGENSEGNWVETAMKTISPYFETIVENPLPFIFTFLSGIMVFIVYMYKQARPATAELMQQAKASKAAIEKEEAPEASPVDQDDDEDEDDE